MKYSIILVAYNAFDLLEKCLNSIHSCPIEDYEIIIVDNSPGTRTPTETAVMEKADWVIHPMTNLGFAKGCNVGAMQAKGEYLIFLNPDTEVYGDWADKLAAHLDSDPEVGAVGPISNFVAGGQNEVFHRGNMKPEEPMKTKLLIGFCLMIREEVYDEMAGMDPELFLGNDDLDLSWRLRLAGYTLLIAPDVFVYHAGHKCMETEKPEHIQKLLDASTAHLKAKIQAHYPIPPSAVELWGVDFFQTRDKGPLRLSVVMIVRDEYNNIDEMVPSLGFADEIIIVDTGSADKSDLWLTGFTMACYWGRKIHQFDFPWVDDFAAARNFAKSKATGDYILWLDADDRISPESAALIRAGMDNPSERMLRKTCYFDLKLENTVNGQPGETLFQPRIFPNLEPIQWEGRVHESLIPSFRRMALDRIPAADIKIVHTGYDTYDLRIAKANRNMDILRTMPDTPQKYWDMGNCYAMAEQFTESYGLYRLILDRWEKHLDKGFRDHIAYQVGNCLFRLGAHALALEWLTDTAKPDAVYMRALCLEALGKPFRPVLETYLALPEIADSYGSNRALMRAEAERKLNG